MSATTYHSTVANAVIDAIRVQVAVRKDVLDAAKGRRDRVRELAHEHDAARATFNSGSVAHGTANAPLRAAGRRRRRAPPRRRWPTAARDRALDGMVGHRALRQARPHPPRPARAGRARRDHRLGEGAPHLRYEELLVSLPRTGRAPRPLTKRDVGRIVARYAELAGLPEDRRTPHVLRHTFCTHVADADTPIDVIRELAGHADIRTTTIYTVVADERLEDAIASVARRRQGLGRLAA